VGKVTWKRESRKTEKMSFQGLSSHGIGKDQNQGKERGRWREEKKDGNFRFPLAMVISRRRSKRGNRGTERMGRNKKSWKEGANGIVRHF